MKQDVKEIFCDNHLLVLEKPAGLLTQPSGLQEFSLEEIGKDLLKERFQKKGNVFLHAVHRIDRSASGLVLFARTSKALSRLNETLRAGKMSKQYLAIVEGEIPHAEGILEHFLIHDNFRARVVSPETTGAKLCHLTYSVLKKGKGYSFLQIFLKTGRYHQIRAQISESGYPIVGDVKYGSKTASKNIFLHHYQLEVSHPVSNELLRFISERPATWQELFP